MLLDDAFSDCAEATADEHNTNKVRNSMTMDNDDGGGG